MNGNIRKQKLKFHETVRSLMRRSLVSFNEHLKFQIAVLVTQKSEISLEKKQSAIISLSSSSSWSTLGQKKIAMKATSRM
jgi:hypothetical protein